MVWEILSLSRLQKMLKVKRSAVSKVCSVEKAKCVPEQSFASTSEESISQSIQSHKGLFKEIKHAIWGYPKLSQWGPGIDEIIQE